MINELNNTANVSGTINGQTTTLTSNTLEVNVINGLTAVKSADKTSWADGELTYTLTINNTTGQTCDIKQFVHRNGNPPEKLCNITSLSNK